MPQDIGLVFGVAGGGSISGESGQKILHQINNIVGNVNKRMPPLKLKADYSAVIKAQQQLKHLSAQIDAINAKPLKIAAGVNGSGKGSTSGKTGKGTDPIKALEADARKAQRIINTLSNKEMKFLSFDKALGQTKTFGKAINELKDLSSTFSRRGKVIPIEKMDQAQIDILRKYIDLYNKLPNKINSAATATKKMKMRISEVSQAQRALNGLNSKTFAAKGLDKTLSQVKQYRNALAELKVLSRSFTARGNRGEILPATQLSKTQLSDLKRFIELYNKLPSKMSAAIAANKKYGQSTTSLSAQVKKAQKAIYGFGAKEARLLSLNKDLSETQQLTSRLAELKRLASTFTGANGKIIPVSQMSLEQVANLQKYIDLYDALPAKINAASAATKMLRTETTEGLLASKALNQVWGSFNKMKGIERFPEIKKDYVQLMTELEGKTRLTAHESAQFTDRLKNLENRAYKAGAGIRSFTQELDIKLLEQVRHLISSFATMFIMQGFRTLYRNVLEVDTAMTELKKVTEATSREYVEFLDGASERAKKLGASLKEVINATADYARMGYSIEEASQLADTAIVYQNVGDGLQDIDEATSHLISTMTAFGKTANDAMHIVDIFNEVANNYAVSAADIGTGLKKSAAAMSAAGNSLEETVALFTAANTIAQDAETVGTALKTMSMRLRSTKSDMEAAGEDTEGMADSVSSLRNEILALTGVDIQLDDNTYKSSYQMLKDIAAVWDKLDDLTQANVLERLFGKRQANIGSGLLENFEIADKALATALDSSGSALRENEEYLESIQGHLDQLSASFQTFAQNFLDSEFVKTVIDLLRGILDFFNGIIELGEKFGNIWEPLGDIGQTLGSIVTLSTILAAIDVLWGFKHVGSVVQGIKKLSLAIKMLVGHIRTLEGAKIGSSMLGLNMSEEQVGKLYKVIGFIKSNLIGIIPVAIIGIALAVGVWQQKLHQVEETTKKIAEKQEEYASAVNELESLNDELEKNKDKLDELQGIKIPSVVESEEIDLLKEKNQLLEDQIEYQRELANLKQDETYDEVVRRVSGNWLGSGRTWGYSEYSVGLENAPTTSSIAYYSSQQKDIFEDQINTYNAVISAEMEKGAKANQNLISKYTEMLENTKERYLEWKQNVYARWEELEGATDAEHVETREFLKGLIDSFTYTNDSKMTSLISDSRYSEIIDFMKQFKSVSITDTVFGNIDLNNREAIEWNDENIKKYKIALESLGLSAKEVKGQISTVLGSSAEYEGTEIAFSPMLQTGDGEAVLLEQSTIDKYIYGLIEAAGENWTGEDLLKLDTEGLEIDGQKISNILAAVGEDAIEVGEAMHYLGEDGAIAPTLIQEFIDLAKSLDFTIEQVEESVDSLQAETEEDVDISIDTASLKEAREAVKNLSSELKSLADAFKEQNENGSLSVDTILDVVDAGYAAALVIDQETGAVKLDADMYLILAKAKIAERIASLQVQKSSLENTIALAKERIAALKAAEGYAALARLQAEVHHLENTISDAETEIIGLNAEIAALDGIDVSNITAGIYGIGDAASDAKSKLSNLQSGMETLLSQTVSWLKDEYSRAQDAQEKYYESQIDALEEAKDAAKERWDAEKEALEDAKDSYNDLIDAQIELLKRQKDADDYAKNRAEKEKAVSDIEAQLLAIENDDSIEAQKMRLELEEQLKEAQDELDELQTDREYELREQALQDEKDRYNDEVDAKLEAIEKQSEAEEKAYQDRIDRLQKYLDAVRDSEKTEAQWRAEAYDWIENRESELYQQLLEWNRIYGDGRDSTVEAWFKEAEGWKAWGSTFAEARDNLARYLQELEEAAGGVVTTTKEAEEVAATELLAHFENILGELLKMKDQFVAEGDMLMAHLIDDVYNSMQTAMNGGYEFTEEMLAAMSEAIEAGDLDFLNAVKNMMGYYNEFAETGMTDIGAMSDYFTQALILLNENQRTVLEGMYNNIKTVAQAAYDMNELMKNGWTYNDSTGWTSADGTMSEFDQGGVVDYTGPAAVHGSKSHPEVVFNADAAAKLYHYVVNTPDLLKSAFASITTEAPKLQGTPIGMAPTTGDININISGNADADTVNNLKKVAETLKQEVVKTLNESMNRRGLMRSPRLV